MPMSSDMGGDMPMSMSKMMMPMWFYSTTEFTLLIKELKSNDMQTGKYILWLAIIFVMGFAHEALNFHRN